MSFIMNRAQLLVKAHGLDVSRGVVVLDAMKITLDELVKTYPLLAVYLPKIRKSVLDYWMTQTVTSQTNE